MAPWEASRPKRYWGTVLGGARAFEQGRASALLEAAEPQAHGVARATEGARGGVDAVAAGVQDQLQAEKILVIWGATHVVIRNRGHGCDGS